jgi:hypothetical protein
VREIVQLRWRTILLALATGQVPVSSDTRYLPLRRNTAHVPARIPTGHRPGRPPTATRLQRVNMEHLPKDEARRIAANIARLAELLGLLRRRGGRRLNRASATLRRGSRIAANITKLRSLFRYR